MIKIENNKIMYIEESSKRANIKDIKGELKIFYIHCIKWCSQSNKRSISWVKSIYDSMVTFKFGLKNRECLKLTQTYIIRIYNNAKKYAANETGIDETRLANLLNNEARFDNIQNLAEDEYVTKILKKYCNNTDKNFLEWMELLQRGENMYYNELKDMGYYK